MSALANTHTGSTKCPQENCEESHVYRGEGEAVGISNLLAVETGMMELHAKGCWRSLKIKRKKKPCSSKEATSSHTLLSPWSQRSDNGILSLNLQ